MKIGNPHNYFVQVWPSWWDEPAETAVLHQDVFHLVLNGVVRVAFVPPTESAAASWRLPSGPATTAAEARIEGALSAPYAVTPDPGRAGTTETVDPLADGMTTLILYVTPDEFGTFRDELEALAESAATTNPSVRHDDAPGLAVLRFVDEQVVSRVGPDVIAPAGGGAR